MLGNSGAICSVRDCAGASIVERIILNKEHVARAMSGMRRMLLGTFLAACSVPGFAQTAAHHQLHIELDPQQHRLAAEDHVTLPSASLRTVYFSLHRDLHPSSPDASLEPAGDLREAWLSAYRITLPAGRDSFTLIYGGEIFHPPEQDAREARNFESTPGIISAEGAVLAGDSGWYPGLENVPNHDGLTFALDIVLPRGWHAVSQGRRSNLGEGRAGWQEDQPQNEIHLIAAPFNEYRQSQGEIEALVYLRSDDAPLAQRYLSATQRYLALYQQLIGSYPYAKFALVENFWQTGYGMPSFTLLGSQVIRLPFIVDSSYPHEILHNWWGNGVYVDYASGNWSEGLTAYLADHLIQEQKGNGADYRRSALQKYADFVSTSRDFPLTQFTSRHSAQSEAVGYGKAMMVFHMLRMQLGDATFTRGLRDFYRDYRFKRASFADLERSFSKTAGQDLSSFFAQWVQQAGAPQLQLVSAQAQRSESGYELSVIVEQSQPGAAYKLDVPIAVTLRGQETVYAAMLKMKGRRAELRLQLAAQPLRVDVDAEFDLFRRLDQAEIPPALSQVLGAEQLLIVLPRSASETLRAQYQKIAQAWQQQPARETRIKWDDEVERLPDQGAVWLFGAENRWCAEFDDALQRSGALDAEGGAWLNKEYDGAKHALVLTARIRQTAAGWLAAPDAAMLAVLARKLPHYAKYSYAAFVGHELNNIGKGMWPVGNSPLSRTVQQGQGDAVVTPRAGLAIRKGLLP